eukprot:Sspe_Gene.26537::Locus_11054_Transcript_3_3_Confidence_0.600_Length_893::g.26537::m.26537
MPVALLGVSYTAVLFVLYMWAYGLAGGPLSDEDVADSPKPLQEFLRGAPGLDGEFFMVNLIRFRRGSPVFSDGFSADPRCAGSVSAADSCYGQRLLPVALSVGSFPVYVGRPFATLLSTDDQDRDWDQVAVMRYRSPQDFVTFAKGIGSSIEYKWASVEDTMVIGTVPAALPARLLVPLMLAGVALPLASMATGTISWIQHLLTTRK